MIELRYSGKNRLLVGKLRIVGGVNLIEENLFYSLMSSGILNDYIKLNLITFPEGTLLKRPPIKKDESKEKAKDEKIAEDVNPTLKELLKSIQESNDIAYLNSIIKKDDRNKVKYEAQKRKDFLASNKKA